MSSDLLGVLWSFQPYASDVQQKRAYDTQARHFVQTVANISASHFLRGADTPQDVLEVLDPQTNSIAYIYALHNRIAALDNGKFSKGVPDQLRPGGSIWNKVQEFMEKFDPVQVRYVGPEWRRLMDYLERAARLMGMPGLAISPIRAGLLRLDPQSGTFTLTHLHFVRLCMETRSYAAALPVLDNYIHSIPSALPKVILKDMEYSVPGANHVSSGEYIHTESGHTDKVTTTNVQEYYVLGAMAYMGVSQFKKAMEFLEHVLVVPANNVANGLMLEAYKKWVLLSCLANGSLKPVPRTTNGAAVKQIRAAAKAYDALGEAFTQLSNPSKLKAQINAGRDLWAEDGNIGLVKALAQQQQRFYITRLSKTYSAIPIANIANNLGCTAEELTAYLDKLIAEGQLNAGVERTGTSIVLRFFLDPTKGPLAKTESQQQQALLEQTQRTNVLAEQVKSADYKLSLTKEYVEHIKRQNKKMASNATGEPMDTTWDDGMADEEDLMGDLH